MTVSETELLPCPFCGKPPAYGGSGERQRGLMIECVTDGCVNPHVSYYDHPTAILKWNTRALTAALSDQAGAPKNAKPAYWTHDAEAAKDVGHLYYFAPTNRAPPPYKTQRHVNAIVDIAADGTLAGVELIDDMPPPPSSTAGEG